MQNWAPDRVHRFKNILAFLCEMTACISSCRYEDFSQLSPTEIEAFYLRFLGPDLPTPHEYTDGISAMALPLFNDYCDKYNNSEVKYEN